MKTASKPVIMRLGNGHTVRLAVKEGWLVLRGDSTLTVRPMDEKSVYVRPVGYTGAWIPSFTRRPA